MSLRLCVCRFSGWKPVAVYAQPTGRVLGTQRPTHSLSGCGPCLVPPSYQHVSLRSVWKESLGTQCSDRRYTGMELHHKLPLTLMVIVAEVKVAALYLPQLTSAFPSLFLQSYTDSLFSRKCQTRKHFVWSQQAASINIIHFS
jgi:hypothetical protein